MRSDFGELDLLVRTALADIAIKVKYLSGLSSDDDVDNYQKDEFEKSINQLARYADFLMQDSERQHKGVPLVCQLFQTAKISVQKTMVDIGVPLVNKGSKGIRLT